jgi:hypothetical protein
MVSNKTIYTLLSELDSFGSEEYSIELDNKIKKIGIIDKQHKIQNQIKFILDESHYFIAELDEYPDNRYNTAQIRTYQSRTQIGLPEFWPSNDTVFMTK